MNSLTVWGIMVGVVMVEVVVTVYAVVAKILVWAGVAVNDMVIEPLVIDVWVFEPLSDVGTGTVVVLEFVVPVS